MEKCLSHYQEYNAITSVTAGLAFRDLIVKENFNPYYNSTVDYAEKFFQAVTDDAILNNLATSIVMGNQNLVSDQLALTVVAFGGASDLNCQPSRSTGTAPY